MVFRVCVVGLAFLLAWPERSWAIDVAEVRWGFDGRATSQCFNPLSVLIVNLGAAPFDGTIELLESTNGGARVGARLAERVYLAPNSSRWVQFYPFVKERYERWSLQWGLRPGERADVPRPVLATQGPVLLVELDDALSGGQAIRRFPEHLFPPIATATDGLKGVALDHVPRWEEARRQAFYNWLYRGGRLHLFKDVNGAYPQFAAQLAELNSPAVQFRIGLGEVIRHDRPRSRIDAEFVEKALKNKDARDETSDPDDDTMPVTAPPTKGSPASKATEPPGWRVPLFPDLTGGLFVFLKNLTRPQHNWALIYTMTVLYVVTVVPGVHFLGRKRFDYRLVYGVLVGSILLFSVGFAYFGRRGHKEATTVNSVSVARELPAGAWDVTSWSNMFVVNGADYAIVHGGTERLYSTAQAFEAVNGVISNGVAGRFDVDIPPFSSQTFVHRMKLKGQPFEIKVQQYPAGTKLSNLVLTVGEGFSHPTTTDSIFVLYRNQICPMRWSKGRLTLAGTAELLSQFLASIRWNDFSPYAMRFTNVPVANQMNSGPPQFDVLMSPLIAWSLGLRRQSDIGTFVLPDDRLRIFLWSELPESLKIEGPGMGKQQGRVLYVVDVQKPVKS
jgi:hypothetical protein